MEFDYTRKKGQKLTYHVKLTIMPRMGTGEFEYSALIHCGADFMGPAKQWPLMSKNEEEAETEARLFIERDIEDLVGVRE